MYSYLAAPASWWVLSGTELPGLILHLLLRQLQVPQKVRIASGLPRRGAWGGWVDYRGNQAGGVETSKTENSTKQGNKAPSHTPRNEIKKEQTKAKRGQPAKAPSEKRTAARSRLKPTGQWVTLTWHP